MEWLVFIRFVLPQCSSSSSSSTFGFFDKNNLRWVGYRPSASDSGGGVTTLTSGHAGSCFLSGLSPCALPIRVPLSGAEARFGIAFRITEARKPSHHVKVAAPGEGCHNVITHNFHKSVLTLQPIGGLPVCSGKASSLPVSRSSHREQQRTAPTRSVPHLSLASKRWKKNYGCCSTKNLKISSFVLPGGNYKSLPPPHLLPWCKVLDCIPNGRAGLSLKRFIV
jgi:hypothetical protein